MKPYAVTAGERLVDAQSPTFGQAWIVEKTFVGTDGREYARVVLTGDHTRRKTLSTAVLADRTRFVPA